MTRELLEKSGCTQRMRANRHYNFAHANGLYREIEYRKRCKPHKTSVSVPSNVRMELSLTTLAKAEIFCGIFQHIKTFAEFVNIIFSEDGLYVQTMDHTRVAIMDVRIPNTWFDEYNLTNDGDVILGINTPILFKILNTRDKNQTVNIVFDNQNSDKLSVYFKGGDKTVYEKSFEIPLADLDVDNMEIPEIEYAAEFSLPSATFAAIVSQLKLFGETVDFFCSEERITLNATSVDQGKMSVDINMGDLAEYAVVENSTVKMSFSLNYLHNICLYHKLSKSIDVKVREHMPLYIGYNLDAPGAGIKFYLAPKIGEDND